MYSLMWFFFFSSRRRHTRFSRDWSSDVCSSDLGRGPESIEGQLLTAADARPLQGPVADDPGAEKRRGLDIGEGLGNRIGEGLRHYRVLGEATVGVPAREARVGTEVLFTTTAGRA